MTKQLDGTALPLTKVGKDDVCEFPSMRYLGSKRRLLPYIYNLTKGIRFSRPLDLYSGTGSVSWLFRLMGKTVTSNDALAFPSTVTSAMLLPPLSQRELREAELLTSLNGKEGAASKYYANLFFNENDCGFIDAVTDEINGLTPKLQVFIRATLCAAALKKRPRGLFTQANFRSTRTAPHSNENLPLRILFSDTLNNMAKSLIPGKPARVYQTDASTLKLKNIDFLYLDPPYPSKFSDANYLRRYHFLEGVCRGWDSVQIDFKTTTRQVRVDYPRVDDPTIAIYSLRNILQNYSEATWLFSFNSNSIFEPELISQIVRDHGRTCKSFRVPLVASVATKKTNPGLINNRVDEYLFLSEAKR